MVGRLSYRLLKPYPSFNLRRSSLLGAGSIIEPHSKGHRGTCLEDLQSGGKHRPGIALLSDIL